LVLPGLARIVDPRQRAERDATTQLAAMAARLHEELITAERAQRDVLAQRADAERRREGADQRLDAGQTARGDAEIAADRLASSEADVRDLVRAHEASAAAIERERAELLTRREKLARDSRGRLEAAQQDLGRATADAKEAARSAELARERALAAEGSRRESEQRLAKRANGSRSCAGSAGSSPSRKSARQARCGCSRS